MEDFVAARIGAATDLDSRSLRIFPSRVFVPNIRRAFTDRTGNRLTAHASKIHMKTTCSHLWRNPRPLFLLLSLPVLGAGCVGTGPNTQQGAVGGAALGALAGAIIGNNSGSHDALGGALIGGAAGGLAGGAMGNALDHQRGTIYTSEAQATTDYAVATPPPPPPARREVVVVRPAREMVWVDGYWIYESRGYAWMPGHWERPPARSSAFVAPHWQHRGGNYVYVRGYWR